MLKIHQVLAARRDAVLKGEKKDEGFTLIELLIVVLIIGVLAAIAIPVYLSTVQNSKDTSAKDAASSLVSALGVYITDPSHSSVPADAATLKTATNSDSSKAFVLPGSGIHVWYEASGTTYTVCTQYDGSSKYYKATESSSVSETDATGCSISATSADVVQ